MIAMISEYTTRANITPSTTTSRYARFNADPPPPPPPNSPDQATFCDKFVSHTTKDHPNKDIQLAVLRKPITGCRLSIDLQPRALSLLGFQGKLPGKLCHGRSRDGMLLGLFAARLSLRVSRSNALAYACELEDVKGHAPVKLRRWVPPSSLAVPLNDLRWLGQTWCASGEKP